MSAPTPAKLGQGDVEVIIDGDTYVLKPTLHVAQMLSKRYGSLSEAAQRVGHLDINAVIDVICLGLGPRYNSAKQQQEIADKVFKTGLTDDTGGVAERTATFVLSVMRGGRPAPTQAIIDTEPAAEGNL